MELLSIKNDLVFKYIFGRDEDDCKYALIKLLNTILSMDIKSITYLNPINIRENMDVKETIYDIKVVADDGNKKIDLEIQVKNHAGFRERLIMYGAELMTKGALKSGEDYTEIRQCIVVSILDFDLFKGETDDFCNTFYFKEKDKDIILSDIMSIVTLEMAKLKIKPVREMSELELWLNFLRYAGVEGYEGLVKEITEKREAISVANQLLIKISSDDIAREKILARERYKKMLTTELNSAKREGMNEGIIEGRNEGIILGEKKLIQRMLSRGRTIEEASDILGIPTSEILSLMQSHQATDIN